MGVEQSSIALIEYFHLQVGVERRVFCALCVQAAAKSVMLETCKAGGHHDRWHLPCRLLHRMPCIVAANSDHHSRQSPLQTMPCNASWMKFMKSATAGASPALQRLHEQSLSMKAKQRGCLVGTASNKDRLQLDSAAGTCHGSLALPHPPK